MFTITVTMDTPRLRQVKAVLQQPFGVFPRATRSLLGHPAMETTRMLQIQKIPEIPVL